MWYTPSGRQYNFGIILNENEKIIEITFVSRPNNAIGSSLYLLKKNLIKNYFNNEKILKYYGKIDYIQKSHEKPYWLEPSYKKEKPLVCIKNIKNLILRNFNI